MTATDWIAVGAVASSVAAIATAILAGATFWLAKTTRDELSETKRAITATERQADASTRMISEVRMDRDLEWRPHLVLDPQQSAYADLLAFNDAVVMINIGRGPAFNCVYARHQETVQGTSTALWRVTKRLEVPAIASGGKSEQLQVSASQASPVPMFLFEDADGKMYGNHVALFYQDVLTTRAYRVLPPRAKTEVWTPGEKAIEWVQWYFGWIGSPIPIPSEIK